jgi:predicted lipoprotein with Yx(FWY)xxD motif
MWRNHCCVPARSGRMGEAPMRRYGMVLRGLVLGVSVALVLAACSGDDGEEPAAEEAAPETTEAPPETTAAPEATPAEGVVMTITVGDSDAGEVLVDQDGYVLYGFTNDEGGVSSCSGDCETNWPPLIAEDIAVEGLDESLVGTTQRDDGSTQVTYNNWPLYYFAGDELPGDTNGQAVGDVWWMVAPTGELIMG